MRQPVDFGWIPLLGMFLLDVTWFTVKCVVVVLGVIWLARILFR